MTENPPTGADATRSDVEIDAMRLLELVPRMNRWAEMRAARSVADGEISIRQLSVLYALQTGQVSKTDATAAELARWARVRPTVMTRMIDRLERAHYIERVADKIDRRRTHIRLTSHGSRICTAAGTELAREIAAAIVAVAPGSEHSVRAAIAQIETVYEHLERTTVLDPELILFDE